MTRPRLTPVQRETLKAARAMMDDDRIAMGLPEGARTILALERKGLVDVLGEHRYLWRLRITDAGMEYPL